MIEMKKEPRLLCCLISVLFCSIIFMPQQAFAKANPRYASIVIEADTGTVLEQQHADKALYPASLTKIMTLLMLFEALEQGRVNPKDRIRISRHAASMVPSKLGLKPGASIRVRDAIDILVTKSANDIAVAVGEHLGRSEKGFARMMNRKAIQIGMRRTTFVNASGLHNKKQTSTARDMAIMARYVINVYPSYYRRFKQRNFTYAGKTYRNHNRLMERYNGMDGMKTGYVGASGFNLVASAVRNNRRIIAVVFGGRTSKSRNAHVEILLNRGFGKLNSLRIARAKPPLPAHKPPRKHIIVAQRTPVEKPLPRVLKTLVGEGDFDLGLSRRFETGLLAVAAYKGQQNKISPLPSQKQIVKIRKASLTFPRSKVPWSVQIGAFKSRTVTNQSLHKARSLLPSPYSQAQPIIAPLKTAAGWLFRARLTGFTKTEAYAACAYLKECLPVAPQN